MKNKIPTLFSEKVILVAKAYNLKEDPFTGLITAHLNRLVNLDQLNKAYQKIIKTHTSFNLSFQKLEESSDFAFEKERLPPSSSDIKVFRNKNSFLSWKKTPLPQNPLQEIAIYKGFLHKTLGFKFHHLILDGRSLFYFFEDLSHSYLKLSHLNKNSLLPSKQNESLPAESSNSKKIVLIYLSLIKALLKYWSENFTPSSSLKEKSDFKIYQKVMTDFSIEEKRNKSEKINFWKEQMNHFKKGGHPQEVSQADSQTFNDITSQEPAFHIRLSRFQLKKLAQAQLDTGIKMPYLLFSLYSKSLQETFHIENLILRTAFSARHNLTDPKEKKLIASLSRSAPLFIKEKNLSITNQALSLKKQVHQLKKYLILDKFPLDSNELKSYSKLKNQSLSLSMSYFFYKEENFLGHIKKFSWQSFFLDLVLFVILSEKTFLLSFSYNPNKFSKKDLKKLSKEFSKQIKTL